MYHKLRYIQDKDEVFEQINEYANKAPEYKLKANDILYIRISSTNNDISKLFELEANGSRNNAYDSDRNFYLQGFTLDSEGYIELPVAGKINLKGLTVDQAQFVVQKKVDEFINNGIVKLKLVSFYIDFLGELNKQGRLMVRQDNINILDAIAQMGGITDYGNRSNVLIIRKTEKGTKTFRVDLTQRKLLNSEQFYMLPYDMVVVEPLRRKSLQLSFRDYSLAITTITSTITFILLVMNLSK